MVLIILFTHKLCTRKTVHLFSVFSHYTSGAAPGTKLKKPFITACNCFCSAFDSNSSLVWCLENKNKKNSAFNMPKCYRFTLLIMNDNTNTLLGCYLDSKQPNSLLKQMEAYISIGPTTIQIRQSINPGVSKHFSQRAISNSCHDVEAK